MAPENGTDNPEVGQAVRVRNRLASIRAVEPYDHLKGLGRLHIVDIEYLDEWRHPESEQLLGVWNSAIQVHAYQLEPVLKALAMSRVSLLLDGLGELAADPTNLGAIGELFRRLNVRRFLSFREERPKKRVVNRVAGGVVTFGATPPPVPLYEGPTGCRAWKGRLAAETGLGVAASPALPAPSGEPDDYSLGNLNRGERI